MESYNSAPLKDDIEEIAKYDPEFRFRKLSGITLQLSAAMMVILSLFHLHTAGFGVLQEWRHRAFHLAFVLPLVFLLYSIRKPDTAMRKHFIFDLLYSLAAGGLALVLFGDILKLTSAAKALVACGTFLLALYLKRRQFWSGRIFLKADLAVFAAMIAGLGYGGFQMARFIDTALVFKDLNLTLVFWSSFLFLVFAGIISLFILQFVRSLRLLTQKRFSYVQDDIPYFDVFLAILATAVSVYIFLEFNSLFLRAGLPSGADLIIGALAFLLILEGARRSIGPALPIISLLVLINAYLGPYFLDIPGLSFFAHRGYSVERIVEHMFLGTEGIFGIPLGVVATFVFHFVLFGIFISKTGLGQLFIDLAMALAGWTAGGPAKVAVISSGFMGSISGSSIANTVTTGSFTIPLMKRVGYSPQFAGAVEASASTGGQLMPPIMGAAAFIMAEFLGIPYIKVAAAAAIPAILYFFAVGLMVHLEAKKQGLVGLPREVLPRLGAVLKDRWLLVLPLFIIIYLLVSGHSPFLAAFWGIIYAVAMGQIHGKTYPLLVVLLVTMPSVLAELDPLKPSLYTLVYLASLLAGFIYTLPRTDRLSGLLAFVPAAIHLLLLGFKVEPALASFWSVMVVIGIGVFYEESKMKIGDILETLQSGTKNALAIGAACACIGFIVGATTLTGLGLKFASAVIALAKGASFFIGTLDVFNLFTAHGIAVFFTLIFTALACFILGMGIPTTAQYIIAVMIAAPALLQLGIEPLTAHMFVLFFAVLADVTPPVALAAYAASGISGANPFRTGLSAFGLASAGFCIPFIFVSAPIVLWLPTLLKPEAPLDYLHLLQVLGTMFMGVIALGSTVVGYLRAPLIRWQRLLMGLAAFGLLDPGIYTDLFGFAVLSLTYIYQRGRTTKRQL